MSMKDMLNILMWIFNFSNEEFVDFHQTYGDSLPYWLNRKSTDINEAYEQGDFTEKKPKPKKPIFPWWL